jgi:DUF4097 and DUF4098 domain-containing protein YvlB
MSEEKRKILQMVAEGKLTPEEAERLIDALSDDAGKGKKRFFKVRVYEKDSEKPKVRVDIPIAVLKLTAKIGSAFKSVLPESAKVKMNGSEIALDAFTPEMIDKILETLNDEEKYFLAQVTDEEKGEYVEVYIE